MVRVELNDVSVVFPIFENTGRSFKTLALEKLTGGVISAHSKGTSAVNALSEISLLINSGEKIGLYGHNGSGKTTLLRVLAGAYHPTSGSLQITGTVASLIDVSLGIDPDATGKQNIILKCALSGIPLDQAEEMSDEIIEFADLGDFIHLPVRTYSSGMMLRLAFAIATSISSDVIIMDEWLSVGDEEFQMKAQKRLISMVQRAGILVVASHNLTFLHETCTRLITLDHGRIISDVKL